MNKNYLWLPTICTFGLVLICGCRSKTTPVPTSSSPNIAASVATSRPTDLQLRDAKVNESGVVPILEYHDVLPVENPAKFARSADNFRKDLSRLYSEGYRPISLHDYLDNKVAIPIGTSPVIFTFDDARESQFRYLPNGELDPECALGILQTFAKSHPDFPVRATFYILAQHAFGQPELAEKKVRALVSLGCEIGNHTVTHRPLASLTDEGVQQELGNAVILADKIDPDVKMDTVALPLGSWPHNRKLLAAGTYNGITYANRAVLKVGAGPAPSPSSVKFNPMSLPRIQASEEKFGSTFWLDSLTRHPDRKYVSDGDPKTVTVPKVEEKAVSAGSLKGAELRTY